MLLFGVSLANNATISPPIFGTNVGGWFILEKFINPSIFDMANDTSVMCEWSWIESVNRTDPSKLQVLRDHWSTWVTELDVAKMSVIGFTHVRIPIGYWAMMSEDELREYNEPFLTGQWNVLVNALSWFKKYNIKVLIDLHGAPGSQNGWDNSGHFIAGNGAVGWGQGDTINRTLLYIERLAQNIAALESNPLVSGIVVGLELINEAFPPRLIGGVDIVKQYYLAAYPVVRKYLPEDTHWIAIEEAFSDVWHDFMPSPEYNNVYLDLHLYQCMDPGLWGVPYSTHIDISCTNHAAFVESQTLPVFVGEWSVAYKLDSGNAAWEPFPNGTDQQHFMLQFALTQMKIYGSYFFWNFKTETAPMWDYFLGVENGWLPSPLPADVSGDCYQMNGTVVPSGLTSMALSKMEKTEMKRNLEENGEVAPSQALPLI
jgi:glucan 1,3-beta-glucosidase